MCVCVLFGAGLFVLLKGLCSFVTIAVVWFLHCLVVVGTILVIFYAFL